MLVLPNAIRTDERQNKTTKYQAYPLDGRPCRRSLTFSGSSVKRRQGWQTMMLSTEKTIRRIKDAQFLRQVESLIAVYRGNEKNATGQAGSPQWGSDFLSDLIQCAYLKIASDSLNPLGDAVEEMEKFEKKVQTSLKGMSAIFKNNPTLQTAFNQGKNTAAQTINYSGKTHPPAIPLQSSVALSDELSTDQKEMLSYLFRASDQVAKGINMGRNKPLPHLVNKIRVSSDVKHWGEYWPLEELIRFSPQLKEKPDLFAQTAGHEITGHSLLEDVQKNVSRGVSGGFEEFLAENNAILALRFAALEANDRGDKALAEEFTAAADMIVKDITRPDSSIPPRGTSFNKRIQVALNRQIQNAKHKESKPSLANHLGQHAYFHANPPSTALGIPMPTDTVHSSDVWTLEGIPIATELKKAYRQYLLQLVRESRKRFLRKNGNYRLP